VPEGMMEPKKAKDKLELVIKRRENKRATNF